MNFPGSKLRQKQKQQELITILLILIIVGIILVIILGIVFLIVRTLRPGNPENVAENLIKSARSAGVPITPEEKIKAEAEKSLETDNTNAADQPELQVPEINDSMPLVNSIPEVNIAVRPASGASKPKAAKPEKKPETKTPEKSPGQTPPASPGVSQEGKIPPPPPPYKSYKIELGLFTDETEVKAKALELKNMGLNPRVDKISSNEFLLSVTERFESIDYATALRDKLIEQGFTNARLATN